MSAGITIGVSISLLSALGFGYAVRVCLRRSPPADPMMQPIGDVPGFSDAQLRALAARPMSAAEADAQRRSFAYGNVHLSNPRVTREMVDSVSRGVALPGKADGGEAGAPAVVRALPEGRR